MRFMATMLLAAGAATLCSAQSENPLTQAVRHQYEQVRQNLIETAEAMPEQNYGFRLTPEQRPFAEWIGHTAMGNYFFCSTIKGVTPPDTKHLRGLTGKAELVKALEDCFRYCDEALKDMSDRKALSEVMIGPRKTYPVQAMISLIVSDNEHYGNLVGYLRSKGIVPPSTARGKKRLPEPPIRNRKPETK